MGQRLGITAWAGTSATGGSFAWAGAALAGPLWAGGWQGCLHLTTFPMPCRAHLLILRICSFCTPAPPAQALKDKGVKVVLIEPSHIATDMAQEQVRGAVGGWGGRGPVHHCVTAALCPASLPPCALHHCLLPCFVCCMQEGTRYRSMDPGLMIQPEDMAQAALLAFRLSPAADPVEMVLNRLQTPYQE